MRMITPWKQLPNSPFMESNVRINMDNDNTMKIIFNAINLIELSWN